MNYQTVPRPDGTTEYGLFQTIEWFDAISKWVNFRNRTVLDIGCNHFSYGLQAFSKGAEKVIGIDINQDALSNSLQNLNLWSISKDKYELVCGDISLNYNIPVHDIVIFSMVIYWINDAPTTIRRVLEYTKERAVFIFRPPTDNTAHYQPTIQELSTLLGKEPIAQEVLLDNDIQHIDMVIYDF
jgi:SAM-dependent methyltransferase